MPVRPTHNSFGERLRGRRKAVRPKLSQEELAERIGVTHGTISRLERGEITPSGPMIQRLATELGCRPGDLLDEGEEPELAKARDLLGKVPKEDLPNAIRALRGFVREGDPYQSPATAKAEKRRRKPRN